MRTYEAPGVYHEIADTRAPGIAALRTDIAGFVGIAARGPIDTPVPVESWRQFRAHFGGFIGAGYLAYVVRAFFENGGQRCWVVRVAAGPAGGNACPASAVVPAADGLTDALLIEASSPGGWGESLTVEVREIRRAQTVTVPDGSTDLSSRVESTSGLERRSFVRLQQPKVGAAPFVVHHVVSAVDHTERRVYWVSGAPDERLPTDQPLTGFRADQPIHIESLEYTFIVREDGRVVESHEDLALVPGHERYVGMQLGPVYEAPHIEARRARPRTPRRIVAFDRRPHVADPIEIPSHGVPLTGSADGLTSLSVYDFVGEDSSPQESDEVQRNKRRGLRALHLVDEIAIVAVPDIHIQPSREPLTAPPEPCVPDPCLPTMVTAPPIPRARRRMEQPPVFDEAAIFDVQAALVEHCEGRGDRFALLDPPFRTADDGAVGLAEILAWRRRFETKHAALYYPWMRVVDPIRTAGDITRVIPPSGHVAGCFAETDLTLGVQQAAANTSLDWIQDVTMCVSDTVHGVLNTESINAIRALPGRGIRIFGARTLSSDPDWRFVNVRRLLMMVVKAVDLSTQWSVFEPNNAYTRMKVRLSLVSFLTALWQQGALTGDQAEQAFFVRCDESNNPPALRDRGQLIVDVGVAPSVPFEFVVLRIGRTGNEFEVDETVVKAGTAW